MYEICRVAHNIHDLLLVVHDRMGETSQLLKPESLISTMIYLLS